MLLIMLLFSDPLLYVLTVCTIVISIVIHEIAHGWAAISYGDDTPIRTGHMTLNPVTHMGETSLLMLCITGIAWGAMPINPRKFSSPKWGNVIVALAGPVANLAIALLFVSLIKLFHYNDPFGTEVSHDLLGYIALLNMAMFLFNLLPVPPLDGFHVISEFFPSLKVHQENNTGLLVLMFLFTAGFGRVLFAVADFLLNIAINL